MNPTEYKIYCDLLHKIEIPYNATIQEQQELLGPIKAWLEKNTPEKLYKYRCCNENNLNAFLNAQIWFAPGSKMNDDFDALLYCDKNKILTDIHSLFDKDGCLIPLKNQKENPVDLSELDKIFGIEGLSQTLNQQISSLGESALIDCSKQIYKFIEDGFNEQFPFISQLEYNSTKFSSFCEDIDSPLMWGHYANNSTGFALAYDFRNFKYNDCAPCPEYSKSCFTSNSLYPVEYRDTRLDATDFARYIMQYALTKHLLIMTNAPQPLWDRILQTVRCQDVYMLTKIILQKSTEWRGEKEWRLTLVKSDQLEPCIKKKPCALYLGRKISKANESLLRNIAHKHNIPVYKMYLDDTNREYKLIPKEVPNSPDDIILK